MGATPDKSGRRVDVVWSWLSRCVSASALNGTGAPFGSSFFGTGSVGGERKIIALPIEGLDEL